MVSRKSPFGWVRFHIEISNVTGPKFTGLVSPNAGGIAVDQYLSNFEYLHPFRRYSPPNFEVVQIGPNFACFWPLNFFGVAPLPKVWTGIIKLGLVLTTVQSFAPIG